MTLQQDMVSYLATKGLGTVGTNLFEGEFPPAPDDALYVREYGGGPPLYAKDTGPLIRRPRFSVVCRSKSSRTARTRCEDALKHLSEVSGLAVGGAPPGTVYAGVRALREPGVMGRDEGGRERVICDFEATK